MYQFVLFIDLWIFVLDLKKSQSYLFCDMFDDYVFPYTLKSIKNETNKKIKVNTLVR